MNINFYRYKVAVLWLFILFGSQAVYAVGPIPIEYELHGVKGVAAENVKIGFDQLIKSREIYSMGDVKALRVRMLQLAVKAVQPFGYFAAKTYIDLLQKTVGWKMYVQMDIGEVAKVRKISFVLHPKPASNHIARALENRIKKIKGSPFVLTQYKHIKQNFLGELQKLGYVRAHLSDSVAEVYPAKAAVDLSFKFDLGLRYHYGPIYFFGSILDEAFIKRYLHFRSGQIFNEKDIVNFHKDLSKSSYFDRIMIEPDFREKGKSEVPLRVQLVDRKPLYYLLGLGFDDTLGVRASIAATFRRIGSKGHHGYVTSQIGKSFSNLDISYIIPGRNPLKDQYRAALLLGTEKIRVSNDRIAALFEETRAFSYGLRVMGVKWLQERVIAKDNIYSNIVYPYIGFILEEKKGYKDSVPGTVDQAWLKINLLAAPKALATFEGFAQLRLNAGLSLRVYHGLFWMLRGTIGKTFVDEIDHIPYSLQFKTGGSNTLRGFTYQSIGPGKNLREISTELQFKIIHNWYFSVFTDAGAADSEFRSALQQSYGVGVLYRTILGRLEFNIARPVEREGKWRFQIGFLY
jgi:translocation and assembly module TamA